MMMASKVWKTVPAHIPMIKFRKGGIDREAILAPSTHPGSGQKGKQLGATGPRVVVLPTIEDIYLPPRYHRRPIGDKEIEYINRGGPE